MRDCIQITDAEGPIHWMEAARRIAAGAGVHRVGGRIQDAIEHAAKAGSRNGQFGFDGNFLMKLNQASCPIRDRSDLPPQMKKLSLVAPAEIDAAIVLATGESFGIGLNDAAPAACRLLGFARVTEEMQKLAEERRDSLLARGVLNGAERCSSWPTQWSALSRARDFHVQRLWWLDDN